MMTNELSGMGLDEREWALMWQQMVEDGLVNPIPNPNPNPNPKPKPNPNQVEDGLVNPIPNPNPNPNPNPKPKPNPNQVEDGLVRGGKIVLVELRNHECWTIKKIGGETPTHTPAPRR